MAPAAWRDQTDMFLDSNPRFGPQKAMEVLSVLKIMVGVIFPYHPAIVMTRASGVEGGAPWSLRWSICRRRASLENINGYPDALCLISPPP